MNDMRRYSTSGIFISVLLVFSIFTLISISEVNAAEVISVNAKGYENTIIIEFENESASKIKTIKVWPGGEVTFTSFKSEPGWGGGKYSDSKLLIFTATNTLNPGESVKFGLVTDEKVNAINWKALDRNDNDVDKGKISIQVISETSSDILEEESKEVEQAKEIGSELYGTKKFIPEQIRLGSDIRLVGSGFGSEKNLKLYDKTKLIQKIQKTSKILENRANEFYELDVVGDVRHKGMLMGVELINSNSNKTRKSINKIVFEEGKKHNIFFRTLGNVVMLVPPLAISNKEINLLIDGTIKTVEGISKLLK